MEKIVTTKWEEIWPMANILNEVCHGINVNFDKIGFKYEEILRLLHKLKECEQENNNESQIVIKLNDSEIKILVNSFKEVFRQIEEWEFQTRIGITIQEANAIKEKIVNESAPGRE